MYTKGGGLVNSRDYWISKNGDYGIWYFSTDGLNGWILGDIAGLGELVGYVTAFSKSECLENINVPWHYYNTFVEDWVDGSDFITLTCYHTGKYTVCINVLFLKFRLFFSTFSISTL